MSFANANIDNHDPSHIGRWLAAMHAGRAKASRCIAVTKLGEHCRKLPLRGERLCNFHLCGEERRSSDARRYARLVKEATTNCQGPRGRERAIAALASIERRRLRTSWAHDPTLPGSTLTLSYADERRIERCLIDEGIDVELLQQTGLPPTPRCLDRLRRAAALYLTGRIDRDLFGKRLWVALTDEAQQRRRLAKHAPEVIDLDALPLPDDDKSLLDEFGCP